MNMEQRERELQQLIRELEKSSEILGQWAKESEAKRQAEKARADRLEAENAWLREVIEKASCPNPARDCAYERRHCNCWKRNALENTDV